jgi:hypothetical protein
MGLTLILTGNRAFAQGDTCCNGGVFIDNFNDGVIGDAWNSLATDGSSIYEADGVFNMVVAEGPSDTFGSNQVVDADTKEHVLKGNFDVRVGFQLDPEFHSKPDVDVRLTAEVWREVDGEVTGKVNDSVTISIHKNGYRSSEEHQDLSGGNWTDYGFSSSDDLEGKLRITRQGNLITTYYWDHGWVQHAQWPGVRVSSSDDFKIRLGTFNGESAFSSYWVKWDNLIAHYHQHRAR